MNDEDSKGKTPEIADVEVRRAVKERYSKLATSLERSANSLGGDSRACCGPDSAGTDDFIPRESSAISAGCGSPLLLVDPKEGDSILDLGSGGGIDVFKASQIVGPMGHAIGVDSTPEMVWRARETSRKYGAKYQNVEVRLGEIERLPVESDSIDYVISNCVINLSPDKQRVLNEAFRVLKPDGMLAVADITTDAPIPNDLRKSILESWSACIGGALSDQEYESLLRKSGFEEVHIEHGSGTLGEQDGIGFYSSNIRARKPH